MPILVGPSVPNESFELIKLSGQEGGLAPALLVSVGPASYIARCFSVSTIAIFSRVTLLRVPVTFRFSAA